MNLQWDPGKADLFEAIDRESLISAAGRALSMSYRRVWLLVNQVNRCFREKPVETLAGGVGSLATVSPCSDPKSPDG